MYSYILTYLNVGTNGSVERCIAVPISPSSLTDHLRSLHTATAPVSSTATTDHLRSLPPATGTGPPATSRLYDGVIAELAAYSPVHGSPTFKQSTSLVSAQVKYITQYFLILLIFTLLA